MAAARLTFEQFDNAVEVQRQWRREFETEPPTRLTINCIVDEYFTVPTGNTGVFDPTEIHNRGQLKKHMRDCMIYLGYYLIFFFIYLYCLIISLLQGDPLQRNEDEQTEF
ncbi:hypothetical protein C0J52_07658 [Blattella germanica]|nr:hypothetical protein C0J52_07658 [Blattella germanica]